MHSVRRGTAHGPRSCLGRLTGGMKVGDGVGADRTVSQASSMHFELTGKLKSDRTFYASIQLTF